MPPGHLLDNRKKGWEAIQVGPSLGQQQGLSGHILLGRVFKPTTGRG